MTRTTTLTLLTLLGFAYTAHAQSWRPPAEDARCPSKWGAGDERGSANHMGSATVLRATQLIRLGEVVELGHLLDNSACRRTSPCLLTCRHEPDWLRRSWKRPRPENAGKSRSAEYWHH